MVPSPTFCRIAYFATVRTNLMLHLKTLSDNTQYSADFTGFYQKMQNAQKQAQKMGPLPYLHKQTGNGQHAVFLSFQAVYLYIVTNWVLWPHLFGPVVVPALKHMVGM